MFGHYGNLNCITWAISIRPSDRSKACFAVTRHLNPFLWRVGIVTQKKGENPCFYSKMDVSFNLCKPKGLSPRRDLMQFKSENIVPFSPLRKMEQLRSWGRHFLLKQVCLGSAEHLLFVVRRRSSWALATDTQPPTTSKQISSSKIPGY